MTAFLSIVLTGLGTYFSRALFIVALANRRIPRRLTLAMEYVGPSVLAALVVTLLVSPGDSNGPGIAELLSLGVTAVLSWKTRNPLLTLVVAMTVFWGARYLAGG
ncbi:AzlD domain-containing protein [Haliea sp. E17]|uniref:AzlD domain-containing protein n=1 Tax=Haliea sp. E17 TaxID=3401576 RepID=UPI003AAE6D44